MKITVTVEGAEPGEPITIGFQYKGETIYDTAVVNSTPFPPREYTFDEGKGANGLKVLGMPGKFVVKDGTFVPAE